MPLWEGVAQPSPKRYKALRIARRDGPSERGELGRSETEGSVMYPWEQLPLPEADPRDLSPRTIRYHAANITHDMHAKIHTAVLEAYRRRFRWRDEETPHVILRPYDGEADKTLVEVTMAHRLHFKAVEHAKGIAEIEVCHKGSLRLLRSYALKGDNHPPTLVVLAVKDLPPDYASTEVYDELWRILSEFGKPCDVWDVVLDHRENKISGRRTGKVVIVGHTHQTYFEDCLQERVPQNFTYRGNRYPLVFRGGRPRPKEAQHSSSTGMLAGEEVIEID